MQTCTFSSQPINKYFVWLTVMPALLSSPVVLALTTVGAGQTLDITNSTAPDNYAVSDGGILNSNGANTFEITVRNAGQFNALGGTYTGRLGGPGVAITNASGSLTNSVVTGDLMGMLVNRVAGTTTGSHAVLNFSQVTGQRTGIETGGGSVVELVSTDVIGVQATGVGVSSFGGDVRATGGSITGGATGVRLRADVEGVGGGAKLALDNVQVQGQNGTAILAEAGVSAQIQVMNNTRLLAGNGNLLTVREASSVAMSVSESNLQGNLNVAGNSTASFTFDRGSLTGDVLIEDGSTANVALNNNSQLTGSLNKVNGVTINSGSNWTLTGNDSIGALAMNGGRVSFGAQNVPGTYYQLNVGSMTGNGVFAMKGNFATGERDFLNVTGVSTGSFGLAVAASGLDAASPQQLTLVHTAAGDAQFALESGRVDVGTWSYDLAQRESGATGTDWYLDPTTRTVSPGARSVLALFSAPTTVMLAEDATLRSRMGELRFNGSQPGVWMRTYGNKYNVSSGSGVGYQQTQRGLTIGADVRLGDSQWLAGVMGGYSDTDLDVEQGTSGTIKSYYVGPYATWLDAESGYYFDASMKFNRFDNEAKVGLSDGTRTKGDYRNSGVSVSAEGGRQLKFNRGYFLEPYAKVSLGVIQSRDYGLDNGMQADGDRARSVIGESGVTAGRTFNLDNGMIAQPYARVALQHEFINNNRVTVNQSNQFNNDLSGTRGQLAMGVALSVAKDVQVHFESSYGKGEHIEQPYGVSAGVRWNF